MSSRTAFLSLGVGHCSLGVGLCDCVNDATDKRLVLSWKLEETLQHERVDGATALNVTIRNRNANLGVPRLLHRTPSLPLMAAIISQQTAKPTWKPVNEASCGSR